MKARYKKHILDFKKPSGTSRGVLTQKETWFLIVQHNGKYGIGECGILRGLSIDDTPNYEEMLRWTCDNIQLGKEELLGALRAYPSIQFGLEQAFLSVASTDPFILFASDFTQKGRPIAINGLIWMGDESFMHQQIEQKLSAGFRCIKMKIGAIDFDQEISILQAIRARYGHEEIEIRVDANGAFHKNHAMEKMAILADLKIHSIEQPISSRDWESMAALCANTPLDIALDEELIGIFDVTEKEKLLQKIRPQYIILKPSLIGGITGSMEWIELAQKMGISWWVTSALESNVGLNAIAQWTYTLKNSLPQGLGTGSLFLNNFQSPLTVEKGTLYYDQNKNWTPYLIQELCT